MEIAKEESEAYRWNQITTLANALRRHVAAAMRLEFEATNHIYMPVRTESGGVQVKRILTDPRDPRHNYTADDWNRAAHEALTNGS